MFTMRGMRRGVSFFFSLARLILYFKGLTLLRPTLPAIVEARRRNVGMPQPLLHFGDVGVMRERGRCLVGLLLRHSASSGEQQA